MSNRKYLMFIDVLRDKTLIPYFEKCIDEIKKGSIRVSKTRVEKGYPSHPCFRIDGKEILTGEVLEYYLFNLQTAGFVSKPVEEFTDKMRVLCGWRWDVDRKLTEWINKILREPFFYDENNDKFNRKWVLKPETMENVLSEEYLKYACFIAICFRNYGESYDRILSEEIFSFVTALGSSLPAEIKKNGSGLVPKEIAFAKTADYSFAANDAFATIKITVKTESEATYSKIFDHICDLLEFGFPKSYAIEFKSLEKNYLPIKKLPKKGINQLFANAVLYPEIHSKIEKYARLAMNECEWYNNLDGEYCAMPGTFAVFALGLYDEKYHQLICDYLSLCDGEHQSLQGEFVLAYIEKFGFTDKGLELYSLCDKNIQHLPKKLISLYEKHLKVVKKS